MIRFTGYGVIAEKPRVGQLGQFFLSCRKNYALDQKIFFDRLDELCHHAAFGDGRTTGEAVGANMWCLCFTGRLPWQPAGIKFTQCVSDQKSAFSSLQEKLCVGSKNDWHLWEFSRRSLSACKLGGGEIELRTPDVGAKIGVFVCHAWSACAWGT